MSLKITCPFCEHVDMKKILRCSKCGKGFQPISEDILNLDYTNSTLTNVFKIIDKVEHK
jgi:hypothetical protein